MRSTVIIEGMEIKENIDKITEELNKAEFSSSESNPMLSIFNIKEGDLVYEYVKPIKKNIDNLIEHIYSCRIVSDVGLAILRYRYGSFIEMHRDWEPNDPYVIKYDKPRVDLGCVFYINDDYVGGEMMFFNQIDDDEPYVKIKPNYGTCLLFDSSIYHMTAPTIDGVKYSMTTFYQLEQNE